MGVVARGEVWFVDLPREDGHEIRKSRPCLILSPPEINAAGWQVILAPMTTGSRPSPYRLAVDFEGKSGLILLDQLRTTDIARCKRRLGTLPSETVLAALTTLRAMFSP